MKLISLIALLALVVISEQRVHVKNQLKRSKTVKRVQKSHASTKLNFDFSAITESSQVQFVIGVFNSLAKQFKLAKEWVAEIYNLLHGKTLKCLFTDWKADFQDSFKDLQENSLSVKQSFEQKVVESENYVDDDDLGYKDISEVIGTSINKINDSDKQLKHKGDSQKKHGDVGKNKKSKLLRNKKIWFFSSDDEQSKKAEELNQKILEEDQKKLEEANKIAENPDNKNWMVELAVRIDKLIKSIEKIWENFKSAFNCFKIIIEEIIKIIGYSTSLWDAILSVFGKVIDFVITFTLPVVKWIQKAYQVFQLFITVVDIYDLYEKYPKWEIGDYKDFGEKIVDLIFKIKDILNPLGRRLSQKRRLIQKAQRRFRSGKALYRYRNINGARTMVLY